MKKVFIIHGFMSAPNYGWQPWLMRELDKLDIYCCALPMPKPDKPKVDDWVQTIASVVSKDDEVFFVGHSLGVVAILRYLEKNSFNLDGAVLVSGPFAKLDIEKKDSKIRYIDNFFDESFDFATIKSNCKKMTVVHAIDDKKVPQDNAVKLSNALECPLVLLPKGDHLGTREGVTELPSVLEEVLKMIE